MKLFGILILAFTFTQCASMKMDSNPPFSVKSATYTHITGGLPGNNSLDLIIEFTSEDSVDFEKVFFQNRVTKAVIEKKQDKQHIAARYNTSTDQDRKDLTLHADPKEEHGNTASAKSENDFPFELKENEAIVTYKVGTKIHYYKIENIKKGEKVFMPSVKPQN
ncbi:hypothetical protein [uncultured Tenacibaculum sp.]|uniref:hypothetical protein n=1 Tax=uncultured Tenacibaculum sp. TaxID=174713 RepID=UPI00260D984A|nr:hypothetical protein [uncultured Tenacibaculum sp.]